MKNLLAVGVALVATAGCAGFTQEQVACVVTGFTSADLAEGIDLALAQKIAADCGVTVQTVIDAFNEKALEVAK
jgi:hydrogenase maturation factor